MNERLIDISDSPSRLSARHDLLVIEANAETVATVPLAEVGVIIASHPMISYTNALIARLTAAGGILVVCDAKSMPVGMIFPLDTHHTQAERFARQAAAPLPTRKRLWQQVVRAKISAQAALLRRLRGTDGGLGALVSLVRSGDSTNIEGRASQAYWPRVFGDPSFRRTREGEDQNRHLNYGYAVLRAMAARAVCAAGLHPSLGLHHHNRYDAFCLADDLMEPFRPCVDEAVARWISANPGRLELDREAKRAIVEGLNARVRCQGESRTIMDALQRTAASLAAVYDGQRRKLILPEF